MRKTLGQLATTLERWQKLPEGCKGLFFDPETVVEEWLIKGGLDKSAKLLALKRPTTPTVVYVYDIGQGDLLPAPNGYDCVRKGERVYGLTLGQENTTDVLTYFEYLKPPRSQPQAMPQWQARP